MNRDLEDKMRITQVKSLEAAEKVKSIFHIVGALNLAAAILVAVFMITIRSIAFIFVGAVICLILYCLGDYLYYNLTVKAYTLEFIYNNSCCIADVNKTVTAFNNNMIEGMNIVHANQNRMVSQESRRENEN